MMKTVKKTMIEKPKFRAEIRTKKSIIEFLMKWWHNNLVYLFVKVKMNSNVFDKLDNNVLVMFPYEYMLTMDIDVDDKQ